jgi:aldose 1-epimerase
MLTSQAGESSLVLAPEIGGAIVGWSFGAVPLLRRPQPSAIVQGNVHGLGGFPLIPFSNRIAHGQFRWHGSNHTMPWNLGDHPHTIHGIGWQSTWQLAFTAEQHFVLSPTALRIELVLTNQHTHVAPAGLGLHPYFPRADTPTLRFRATQVRLNDVTILPAQCVDGPPHWNHAAAQKIGSPSLDNCYTGWDGLASIRWESNGHGLLIEADELFRHLIVYTPPGQDFFCLEPVSHMTDAINRMDSVPGHGVRVLASGETVRGSITFRLAGAA